MATQPLSFGSLLPMDGHFESLANKAVADGASTPPVKGSPNNHHAQALPSSPRWGKEEQAAFRAAACLLGKDVPRIAALCSKQAQEIETIWKEVFRGTQSYRAVKLLSPQQRGELATALVMRLAGIDMGAMGGTEDNKMDAVDNGKAAQLQDLASHLASQEVSVGEVVDALLPIVGASTVLQTVMSLVKGSSWGVALMTPGNRELAGWQQASEDDDIDLYSGPRDMTDVSDDDMIDAAAVLSPPDSHLTTGLGAADASVSLAINPSGLMPIKQLQRQQQPTPPTPQQQAQPDSLPPHSRLPPMPPSGPTVQQTGSTPTQGHTPQHTPSHSRKSSRPSTPQRASPPDGVVNKICTNCGTSSTPLWRKEGGVLMCNACGIYFKTHGFHRPVDLIRAATSSRRESGGGSGSVASGRGGGGHTPPGSMMGGGGAGMETPAASSEPGLSAPGGGVAHGDTATSPPHRRRRSSPSPLRFQHSVGAVEGTSSAARISGGGGGGSMFNSDNEDALSDGPGHSGSQGGGGSTRRSGRRRAPRQSWPEYEEIMAAGVNGPQQPGLPTQAALQQQQQQLISRRASSGTGPVGSVLYAGGSSHGKRSRFGEQFHQGGAGGGAAPGGGYHSAPGTHYSGSEYGDDVEAMSRLADVGAAVEGGATSQGRGDVVMQAPNLGREFSFGMPGLDGHGEGHPHPQDTRQGPHGLVCITPRLPSGPIDEAVRRAADEAEAVAAAAGGHGLAPGHAPDGSPTTSTGVGVGSQPRLSMDRERMGGRVSISSVVNDAHHLHLLRGARGPAAVPTTSQQDSGMDVETPDLTIEHDPADVAAVLLGLKHALVLKEDSAPVYHMATSSHRGGARSQNNSGRSSPMRGRRGGPVSALAAVAAAADRGYWSGPDDGPSHRPTKRSRSPMARLLHAEGGGSGSARASPANSGGGGAAAGGGGAGTVDGRPLMVCANCGTSRTPLWRKDKETGESMCNACGIYKQTHGYARPHKGLERDASPSVSGATGGAASGPIAVPRGRARPTGSITSGGAVTGGGGTPPGTSNLGAGSQRRASTGFLAGGRPPLPPPALASRSSQPLPAMQPLQQFPSGASEQATAPAGQSTAAAPSAEPLRPQGQGTPAGGMPVPPPAPGIPWTAHAQGMPGMAIMGSAPWPFYQLQMANMNMAAAHHQSQSQHQQLHHPPAGDRIGSNSSAPGPNPSSSTGTTTSEEQGQATRRQVAPKPHLQSQNAPGEVQVSEQSAPSPTATSSQQNAQAANPSSPGNSGAQLSISHVQHQQLRSQASGTGPMPPPALGMPSDPNQALAAAASLAATLQQHQALAAAAAAANARGRGGQPGDGPAQGTPAAGHPAGWPPGPPPNPFFTSVYSAQHHLQGHPQMHFAGPVQGTVTGMPRASGGMAHPGHMNGQMSGVVNGGIVTMPPRNPFGNPPPWSMAMAAGHPMQHIHADSQP